MRYRTWFSALCALMLILAACGGDGAETTTTAAAAGDTTTTAAAGDTTTTAAGETTTTGEAAEATGYEHLDRAMAGEFSGTTVEIVAQWVEGEAENFNASLDPFREATGIDVQYEGLTDYELTLQTRVDGNDAPDLAQIAQPGKMISYASEGQLVDISPWFNVDKISEEQVGGFVDLTRF
jgi:ABC-type glycerol-3-phosphate transport system substrate-binding protein